MYQPFQEITNLSRQLCLPNLQSWNVSHRRVVEESAGSLSLSLGFAHCGMLQDDKGVSQLDSSTLFWANIKHNCRLIKAQRVVEELCWSHR